MKLLIGGSPCTYWSIAQTKNRETEASGMGWELFRNYVMARDKFQPDYFLYENNKSMSAAIREQITAMLGVEPVLINSALVSAQNRQRLYWCGKREADGSYSTMPIEQPEDRGILLRDVRETYTGEKGYSLHRLLSDREMDYMARETHDGRNHFDYGYIQDGTQDKGKCVTANISKGVPYNVLCEPVCVASRERYIGENGSVAQHYETQDSGKTNALTTVQKDNLIAEPVRIGTIENDARTADFDSQQYRVYSPDGKSVTLCGNGGGVGAKTGLYAMPTESEKAFPIYEVKDGFITIKGKQHPIKLRDGCYIIRKLTVRECMRLQTVPEDFEFPVSDSQAYKMLGNGWTVDVIVHLLTQLPRHRGVGGCVQYPMGHGGGNMNPSRWLCVLAAITFIASCVCYRRDNKDGGDRLLFVAYAVLFFGFVRLLEDWGLM